jgi:hypothetical protein
VLCQRSQACPEAAVDQRQVARKSPAPGLPAAGYKSSQPASADLGSRHPLRYSGRPSPLARLRQSRPTQAPRGSRASSQTSSLLPAFQKRRSVSPATDCPTVTPAPTILWGQVVPHSKMGSKATNLTSSPIEARNARRAAVCSRIAGCQGCCAERLLDELGRLANARDLVRRQALEQRGEVRDAPLAASLHHAAPTRRSAQAVNATVIRVALAAYKPGLLQRLHDPRHRRRPHLFGCGELAQRPRAAEGEHRQRGELRGRHAGRRILAPDVPQRVDGSGVKAVGGVD